MTVIGASEAGTAGWMVVAIIAGVVLSVIVYFAPTFVAMHRDHHQTGAIAVVNVFFGWTFLGWVIAMAMACSATKRPAAAHAAMWAPDPAQRMLWRWWDGYRWTDRAVDPAGRQVSDPV